ncbi:hypothetical protein BGZ93_009012 [Podila epicladia]|nr:hypothetical protein BGZ92_004265 [Podila epicladia]KAG0099128.1 hypothetical protein BGZ93_009012 [Podila epicladia]
MISGTATTVYETLTTTTQTPTVIPDPHQSPPPLEPAQNWPNRDHHLQTWQITTIVIAVLALISACASMVLLGWMRKKRKEDKTKGVLGIGLEPWDEKEKGPSVEGAQPQQQQHQQQQQHVNGGAGSSGDPQGFNGVWPTGAGSGAPYGHSQDSSSSTYNSGYPDLRGYSSDIYTYDLSGGGVGGGGIGAGVSEADYHGLYGGLVMSPQQQAPLPHGHGNTRYYGPNYQDEHYPEGADYYSINQPRVQYPTPPSHNTSSSPTSAMGLLRQGESRAMESMDYVDGYGHGQEQHVGASNRQSSVDYFADSDSRQESHDGTQESATLGRLDSRRVGPGGVNLLWDDPSKDRGQRDRGGGQGGGGARGPAGEGDLNWKVELSRKSPQALRGEAGEVLESDKGKGRAS